MKETTEVKPVEEDIINLMFEDGTNEEVIVPAGTIALLEQIAKTDGKTVEEVIIEAITDYVNKSLAEIDMEPKALPTE